MKVLLVNSTCKVGGVSTFLLSLRSALTSLGHQCELFFFSHGTMEAHLPRDVMAHFGNLVDCMRLVERGRFRVVHANNIDWTTGISAVRHIGARLVLTAHKARPSAWTYGWTSANCDGITAVSNGVRKELQPYTDVPIQVVHNGIDTRTFSQAARPRSSPPIVAWVGRSGSPLKRLDRFAAIAPALRSEGARLWILDPHGVEKGAEMNPDAVRILRGIVDVWRPASYDDMPELYRQVAASGGCVISTSSREGLGLAPLEAQACGCVVIGPDVSGVNESVSPRHGGVLYPFDMAQEDLATLVLETIRDRETLDARGREAASHVRRHFNLEGMAQQYLRVYEKTPLAAAEALITRMRTRLRLSPLTHWDHYLEQRWGVGYGQFESSRALAGRSEWRLAAGAAVAALRTSPTIFLKPQRLAHLISLWVRERTGRRHRSVRPDDRVNDPTTI